MRETAVEEVVAGLRTSRKYSHLCEDTLCRVAGWAANRHVRPKDALKAAKRKLHQVYGAYIESIDLHRLAHLTQELPEPSDSTALRERCREVLALHASTEERLAIVEEVYRDLFALAGPPGTVLDLACGLHPFALPWMPLPEGASYIACDIDRRIASAVQTLFRCLGRTGTAECRDILVAPPETPVDVALLLKTMPCLEQQAPGATLRLIRALQARCVVLSFPMRSLGGREKGMREHYGAMAEALCEALGVAAERLDYPSETFYVLPSASR